MLPCTENILSGKTAVRELLQQLGILVFKQEGLEHIKTDQKQFRNENLWSICRQKTIWCLRIQNFLICDRYIAWQSTILAIMVHG